MAQIDFAKYLVERLKQAGVKQVFGVPGDYNLEFLDYFERDPDIHWVGNANELNAAYSADGYARVKGGLAVLVTTFGVGELSALCGVAGSLAERLPVLHIVGSPSTDMQKKGALLHHTLNTGSSFTAFSDMSRPLSCAQALLNEVKPETDTVYTDVFDDALRKCLTQCRPAYVELPMDVVRAKVSSKGLEKLLPVPHSAPPFEAKVLLRALPGQGPGNALQRLAGQNEDHASDAVTQHVVELITKLFARASHPIVLVDACAERFGMGPTVRKLVETCGIRFFTTPMGKAVLDEHHPLFGGCYAGANSLEPVIKEVESSDFVLYVGSLQSDFNSGSFSVKVNEEITVKLHSYTTMVGYATFPRTDIRHVLPRLIPTFEKATKERKTPLKPIRDTVEEKIKTGHVMPLIDKPEGREIVHKWLWGRMGTWLCDGGKSLRKCNLTADIVITETGTSSFGLLPIPMPGNVMYLSQILWGAIGWSVGACLGAALGAEELDTDSRTVLFVGDGSLQLTVQEIGTMVRRGVKPYLFIISNEGYEIERRIHGKTAEYNDIQLYDHQLLLPFLAGRHSEIKHKSYRCETQDELHALLNDDEFNKPDRIRLIEIMMPRNDAPENLIRQAELTAKANSE